MKPPFAYLFDYDNIENLTSIVSIDSPTPCNIFASQEVAANINLKVYIARGGDFKIRSAQENHSWPKSAQSCISVHALEAATPTGLVLPSLTQRVAFGSTQISKKRKSTFMN